MFGAVLLSLESAQAASEMEQLREELRQVQQEYGQRIKRIEDQLQRLEAQQTALPQSVPTPVTQASPSVTAEPVQTVPDAMAARKLVEAQFARDTESRERAAGLASAPFRDRLEHVLQDFVDIKGYVRAGYGRNNEGGPQVGFQAPGAFAKYRLGNEPENYGELTFAKNFFAPGMFALDAAERPGELPAGPIAHVQMTVSMYNPYQDLLSSSDTTFGLPEAWAAIGNVAPSQPSMKFWAGNRYYRRHDIAINDFFFSNMGGAGGGVEDIEVPLGKFAMAWIGAASRSGFSDVPEPDPTNEAGFSKANWDLRLYDVNMPLGKGEFSLVYARADSGLDENGESAPESDGVALSFIHTREKFISEDGVNKFSVQFGTGAAKTFTSGFETITLPSGVFIRSDKADSWRFRVTESFIANVNDHFSISPAIVYQLTDHDDQGKQAQWVSAGLRPIFHFNQYVSLAFEAGVDWVDDEQAGTTESLYKFTLAPQVSLGGRFMSRPVIRGFVTYARWGDAFIGQVGGNDYREQIEGLTFGVQMESWW